MRAEGMSTVRMSCSSNQGEVHCIRLVDRHKHNMLHQPYIGRLCMLHD